MALVYKRTRNHRSILVQRTGHLNIIQLRRIDIYWVLNEPFKEVDILCLQWLSEPNIDIKKTEFQHVNLLVAK